MFIISLLLKELEIPSIFVIRHNTIVEVQKRISKKSTWHVLYLQTLEMKLSQALHMILSFLGLRSSKI